MLGPCLVGAVSLERGLRRYAGSHPVELLMSTTVTGRAQDAIRSPADARGRIARALS